MNSSLNSLHRTPPTTLNHHYLPNPKPYLHRSTTFTTFCSFRRRRHLRRRHSDGNPHFPTADTNSSSAYTDSNLHMVIDFDQYIPDKASISLNKLLRTAQLKLNQFVNSGTDAVDDLRTLISVDGDRRVVVSCRKSTVYFFGQLIALSLVTVFTFRVLVKLGLGFRNLFTRRNNNGEVVVTRRDRSLGGREVVVSTKREPVKEFGGSVNPLSDVEDLVMSFSGSAMKNWEKSKKKLPDWWPEVKPAPLEGIDKEENQKKANWLIRAIMDYRTSGKDIHEDDIILLRRICRMSGVNVVIDTSNSRDSIYRASVDFTLNTCARVASHSTFVQIDGEDAREFIAGLADNIGLESSRAARMVAAAVAARTRSWLLQAWALEMQGKHIEAVDELSKLCLIHRIFPPDEGSPEMEMVARGLEKHLKLEQRLYLLKMLVGVSSEENRRSLVEALGLETSSAGSVGDEQENMMVKMDSKKACFMLTTILFLTISMANAADSSAQVLVKKVKGKKLCDKGWECKGWSEYCCNLTISDYFDAYQFEELFAKRNSPVAHAVGFWDYKSFITASALYQPLGFGTTGNKTTQMKEIAAFLGHVGSQTSCGYGVATGGPTAWGLCYNKEMSPSHEYCDEYFKYTYPCAPGAQYYGRGALPIYWQYNYGKIGDALKVDLLNHPEYIEQNATLAFQAAIHTWLTPQKKGQPSAHEAFVGTWKPTKNDTLAKRVPGFGTTMNILYGDRVCGKGDVDEMNTIVSHYLYYLDLMGVGREEGGPHEVLTCANQEPFNPSAPTQASSR